VVDDTAMTWFVVVASSKGRSRLGLAHNAVRNASLARIHAKTVAMQCFSGGFLMHALRLIVVCTIVLLLLLLLWWLWLLFDEKMRFL
jgi:hypothetical protein